MPSLTPTSVPSANPSLAPPSDRKLRFYSLFSSNEIPLCVTIRDLSQTVRPTRVKRCGISDLQHFKIIDRGLLQSYDNDLCLMRRESDGSLVATSCPLGNTTDSNFFIYKSFNDALMVGSNTTDLKAITVNGEEPQRNADIMFTERDTSAAAQHWDIEDIL